MNGEGPSVPITTLAGIQSLTDLLLELPLPTPLPGVTGHQSLLSHLRDSEEARRLLSSHDSIFISPLIDALRCTATDHIEIKDGYYGTGSHNGQISQLVQYLLVTNPHLFKSLVPKPSTVSDDHVVPSEPWLERQCSDLQESPQQHNYNSRTISCQSHSSQDNSPNYFALEQSPVSQGTRNVQNKIVNLAAPKSPSTYACNHSLPSPDPNSAPLHCNSISSTTSDSIPSGQQENTQVFNSTLLSQHSNLPQSISNGASVRNGNSSEESISDTVKAKQCSVPETKTSDPVQLDDHSDPSALSLISSNNGTSLSVTNQRTTRRSLANCIQKSTSEQLQPASKETNNSQQTICIISNVHSLILPDTHLNTHPSSVPVPEPLKENQSFHKVGRKNKSEKLLQKNSNEPLKCTNESSKSSNESLKSLNESTKSSNRSIVISIEALKTSNETVKNSSESSKSSSRVLKNSNETVKSSIEAIKIPNKTIKNSNEALKISNKTNKSSNETLRSSNEIITNSNEVIKNSNKSIRNSNECMKESNKAIKNVSNCAKNSPVIIKLTKEPINILNEPIKKIPNQFITISNKTIKKSNQSIKTSNESIKNFNEFKFIGKPIILLTKLSLEDIHLAQKSVKQFIRKNSKSLKPLNSFSQNKNRQTNRYELAVTEDIVINKTSHRKIKTIEYSDTNHRKGFETVKEKFSKLGSGCSDNSVSEKITKKRKSQQTSYIESSCSENNDSDDSYKEDSSDELKILTSQKKKIRSTKTKDILELLSTEDILDTNAYQHFSRIVDVILDSTEDIDFTPVVDEDTECPTEAIIPLPQLQNLRKEASKLKRLSAMNQFPLERLVRLLTILDRNILDGAKLFPAQSIEEQDEEEGRLWLELTMERLIRSADASLTALYIMTSPDMPEKVFLEDIIERIVLFLKYQLENTVFPEFDPAYRLDPKSKDGYAGNIKQKRAHAHRVKEKSTLQLYNRLHEGVKLIAELLELQTLTDTIILQVSTLGVSPFFVEGISELQLNALRLVTTVFSRYDKHRQLILEDILASIARLPTSKRSLRNYELNSEEKIQMLTALVLQLIHSVVKLPEPESTDNEEGTKPLESKEKVYINKDVFIITSYEASMNTAVNFLSVFLKKCSTKNEEMDYRPLFENFVQDLLSTVNKPEWPASELLLSVLGRILVRNFSNKSIEMTLRVASLDYLGVVAAHLRKDAVTCLDRKTKIDEVLQRVVTDNEDSIPVKKSKKKVKNNKQTNEIIKQTNGDEVQILQNILLQYLDSNAESDPALQFSRKFYIAQWYRDAATEIKKSDKSLNFPSEEPEKIEQSSPKKSKLKGRTSRRRSSQISYEEEEEVEEVKEKECRLENDEVTAKVIAVAEKRKRFLMTVIKKELPKIHLKNEEHINYKTAQLISQYLASTRHFSKSFDLYLSQILRVLSETAVAVRTKAMKCLTHVVEADPSILSRSDMQKGVHGRLLDHSTSVREAAVDLLGKFILIRPELISQYYEMLTDRILDTGISVRKRVIKILKDICLEQPEFSKTPEICVKIIRRVNDEDGIKKLVGEVFQSMWFTPVSDKIPERIFQKVKNITHVVEACHDTGLEWFEQLLTNLLKNKEDSHYKSVVKSCKQIIDCLVENLSQLDESSENADGDTSTDLAASLATLHLFCKIHPPFVVPHASTIQPYLSIKCISHSDFLLLKNVAQTLELIIPLIENPSESFLALIEQDMIKLILRQHMGLLPSCVSCLGAVVNRVTKNYKLVRECFQRFFLVLLVCKKEYEKNPDSTNLPQFRPKLLRSLYIVGLFCRHFDFDAMDPSSERNGKISLKNRVFLCIVYFNQHEDEVVRLKALTGLGFIMIRHYEFMLGPQVKTLYHYLLTSPGSSPVLKCQVLKNITNYLVEEEVRMIRKDAEWSTTSKSEDLKEMGDVTSGMASTVIQLYLKQVLDCVLHNDIAVRKASLRVIQLILEQGLVHPVQLVPYLACLGSDDDPVLRTKADQLLLDIEKKYPGFVQMKATLGVRMSYKMQHVIQGQDEILRGFRSSNVSRNGFLYSTIRTTRQSRRAFLFSLLKLFDEQEKTPLTELLYIADNIAYFPYVFQDEPLFIMYQLELMLSVTGSNLLQTFREALVKKSNNEAIEQNPDDDEDDDFDYVLSHLSENITVLQECIISAQGCVLLLYLKQTLKEMYGFTDNKIQQYSPNESAKTYERPLNRKARVKFNPETVINFINSDEMHKELDDKGKEQLVQQYLHFKQLMLTIDPNEDDEDEDNQTKGITSTPITSSNLPEESSEKDIQNGNKIINLEKSKIEIKKNNITRSRRSPRKFSKPVTVKNTKIPKKKRKRLSSGSEDLGSDPDYMDSS